MGALIDYARALELILAQCAPLEAEPCAPSAALGRVLAAPVYSSGDLPPFDNAAMDGFALATGGAALPAGSEHAVLGRQAAGDQGRRSAGAAWEIMTGACLPEGLDSVVPVERTEVLARSAAGVPERVRLLDALQPGQNVRYAGSDVERGALALPSGTRIDAASIMLLAALGVPSVSAVRAPRVAVISTGKELVDDPLQPLLPGSIYASNAPYLVAALTAAGAEVVLRRTVDDVPAAFLDAARQAIALRADVLISTGAVSMGYHDFVPAALSSLGAETLFHKVAIRPGKPLLCARLPAGPLVFGLPGNPMAMAVGLRFFVAPALRALAGLPAERPLRALLDAPCRSKPGLRNFLRARVGLDVDGRVRVRVLPGQESFRIRPLAEANAWAILSEQGESGEAGSLIEVAGMDMLGGLQIEAWP